VQQWVDTLRAEMLLGWLCDEDFNFRIPESITAGFWEDKFCSEPYQRWWKPDSMMDHGSRGVTMNSNGELLTPWPKAWCGVQSNISPAPPAAAAVCGGR
jgi:hypothetical protein